MTRIVVVGAGAIGGFIAAVLARSQAEVAVVARGAHAQAIARDGLHVQSDMGNFTARVRVVEDPEELRDFDTALLTFKAHQWPSLMPQLATLKDAKTTIVTLQNGVPFWYVREPPLQTVDPDGRIGAMFPDDRIVGGVVHVSGTIVEPGRIRQSGGLRYVVGNPNGGAGERCREILTCFNAAGLAPEVDSGIRRTIWLKLVNNVGLNAISVLERLTIKQMLASREVRAQVRRLMVETLEVGRAMQAIDNADVDERIEYAARLSDVKTSMLQDFERGREMEIDPILGAVCELGERHGVPTPEVRKVYEALR